MVDDNIEKNDANKGTKDSITSFTGDDTGASYDLFARLLIKRIVGFLAQRPSDFAITILPPASAFQETAATEEAEEEERDQPIGSDSGLSSSLDSLSSEHRSLLETSIVLMHDPEDTCKSFGHMGLEAHNLPLIARVLRKAYRQAKTKSQNASLPSAAEQVELFHVTSCLLLIQPDHATAWADRRRCLLSLQNRETLTLNSLAFEFPRDSVDEDDDEEEDEKDALCVLWSRELDYLDILVTQHSKAPSSWAHRKYALRQMLQRVEASYQKHGNLEKANKKKDIIFAREVKTCIDVAEKFPKNYYAWTHRRYLWDLFSFETSGTKHRDGKKKETQQRQRQRQRQRYIQLLETELMIGMWQEWLPRHPADHSAVHYSCQVLDLLLSAMISLLFGPGFVRVLDRNDVVDIRNSEHPMLKEKIESVSVAALDQVRILLSKFSHENESLWILRRITYKILWKHLDYYPSVSDLLVPVQNDLRSILSLTLGSDIQQHKQGDNCNYGESDSITIQNPESIHAWTFLAWCIANLNGIDDHREGTNGSLEASSNDIIFTPRIREIASRYLTSTTGTIHHNLLVYTAPSSPFLKILATGTTRI